MAGPVQSRHELQSTKADKQGCRRRAGTVSSLKIDITNLHQRLKRGPSCNTESCKGGKGKAARIDDSGVGHCLKCARTIFAVTSREGLCVFCLLPFGAYIYVAVNGFLPFSPVCFLASVTVAVVVAVVEE